MKKKIAIICALVLVVVSLLTIFAACNKDKLTDEDLKTLRSNLREQYKGDATVQNESYKVIGEISGFNADGKDIKAAVAWSIGGTDKVTVSSEKDANGNYTINLPDPATLTEDLSYTLTGTLVNAKGEAYKNDADETYSVTFDRKVEKFVGPKPDAVLTFDSTGKATQDSTTKAITWTENGITVVNKQGSSTSAPVINAKPARFYKSTTIEVTYTSAIKAIRLTVDLSYANGFDGMVVEGATITHVSDIILITFETPVEKFESAALGSQTRIYKLEVFTNQVPEIDTTRYETEEALLAALKALAPGATLTGGQYSLTGTITTAGTRDAQYNSITVTIKVTLAGEDIDIECYSMKCYADELAEGDEITVTGYIQNYEDKDGNCKLEFAANCTYVKSSDTPTPPTNDGTEDHPYTVAEAISVGTALGTGNYSANQVFVKGYIVGEVTASNSNVGTYMFYISDTKGDNSKTVQVWYALSTEKVPYENDLVVIYGYLQNFSGKVETSVSNGSKDNTEHTIASIERGTSKITAAPNANAQVTNLSATEGLNGTTFTFKVNVNDGWELTAVKVGNDTVTADDQGVYTGTIKGNTTISISLKQIGAGDPVLVATMLSSDTAVVFTHTDTVNTFVGNGITLTNTKNSSGYFQTEKKSDYMQLYASTGMKLEYTSAFNYVVLTCTSNNKTLGGQTVTGLTITENSTAATITITLDSPATSFEIGTLAKQLRVTKIEVYAVPTTPAA